MGFCRALSTAIFVTRNYSSKARRFCLDALAWEIMLWELCIMSWLIVNCVVSWAKSLSIILPLAIFAVESFWYVNSRLWCSLFSVEPAYALKLLTCSRALLAIKIASFAPSEEEMFTFSRCEVLSEKSSISWIKTLFWKLFSPIWYFIMKLNDDFFSKSAIFFNSIWPNWLILNRVESSPSSNSSPAGLAVMNDVSSLLVTAGSSKIEKDSFFSLLLLQYYLRF